VIPVVAGSIPVARPTSLRKNGEKFVAVPFNGGITANLADLVAIVLPVLADFSGYDPL